MHLAAREGLPLQLHVEGESAETYPDLAQRALKQGMDLRKLVRHYSPPDVRTTNTHGLTLSVPGQGRTGAFNRNPPGRKNGFFPRNRLHGRPRRPGAVLGPKTVSEAHAATSSAGVDEGGRVNTHSELLMLLMLINLTRSARFMPCSIPTLMKENPTWYGVSDMQSARRFGCVLVVLMLCCMFPPPAQLPTAPRDRLCRQKPRIGRSPAQRPNG